MSGFSFLELFTGGGSDASANKRAPAPVPVAPKTPQLTREQEVLAKVKRERADQEKLHQGYVNQSTRLREEMTRIARTDRPRALKLLEEAKQVEAEASAILKQISDKNVLIAKYERLSGLAAHATATREMQEIMQNKHRQLDVEGFEEARESIHETVGELNDVERLLDKPLGAVGEDARMTSAQRDQTLSQELDDLLGASSMAALDEAPNLAYLPKLARPVSSSSSSSVRAAPVLEADGGLLSVSSNATSSPALSASYAPSSPQGLGSPSTTSRNAIAQRLAAARHAARKDAH